MRSEIYIRGPVPLERPCGKHFISETSTCSCLIMFGWRRFRGRYSAPGFESPGHAYLGSSESGIYSDPQEGYNNPPGFYAAPHAPKRDY